MGFPKALLPFNENDNFLSYLLKTYLKITNDISVIVNERIFQFIQRTPHKYFTDKINYIQNNHLEKGRIFSVQLGINSSHHSFIFIQNIDNPFISSSLLNSMLTIAKEKHYVVPEYKNKGGHPLLICKEIANEILTIKEDNYNIRNTLRKYKRLICPVNEERVTWNINSPIDYHYAFKKDIFLMKYYEYI